MTGSDGHGAPGARPHTIAITDDYERLVELFLRQGLEYSSDGPAGTVRGWKAEDGEGRLIGGCLLAFREGRYILSGIAIEPEHRKGRLGSALLQLALAEVRSRGGTRVHLVARAPDFFRRHGFTTLPAADVPGLFDCPTCPQYGTTCHPEIMALDV